MIDDLRLLHNTWHDILAEVDTFPENQGVNNSSILHDLMRVIASRQAHRPANSYVVHLLQGGLSRIAAKIHEEAEELTDAAGNVESQRADRVVQEAADLVFHLLVLLSWADVPWSAVEAELTRRFGVGGLDEKTARPEFLK